MSAASIAARLDSLPAAPRGRSSRGLWIVAAGSLLVGIISFATGTLQGGVIALWAFVVTAVALAIVLPLPMAVVSPLFIGVVGWLVDMLPFVILCGWTALVVRWAISLVRERRWPRGGRWILIPLGLVFWTGLGVAVISSLDFKHFLLLLGIQVLSSGTVLLIVDGLASLADRITVASGLVAFVVLLSVAVFLQWVGVNIQGLQNGDVRKRVEAAYSVDAFPNDVGMIKYARSVKAGSQDLRRRLENVQGTTPGIPDFLVFQPKFQAFENHLVVRFQGSARAYASELHRAGVDLVYDNVGVAPANTVPRMRSFPRNALTYAGVCAAALPFAMFLVWVEDGRRRWLGRLGVAACLFGAGFSLARGAWVALAIGIVYLLIDAPLSRRRKIQFVAVGIAGAIVLTGVFLVKYKVDPLSGRAGGGASVKTRDFLYKDTLGALKGIHLALGYGTEQPRTANGLTHQQGGAYVPRSGTHSTYLNYLFRTGLPGLLLVVALYALAFLCARAAAKTRAGPEQLFAGMCAVAIVIAAAHDVILSLYVEPIYTLVISVMLGLAIAGGIGAGASLLPWRTQKTR